MVVPERVGESRNSQFCIPPDVSQDVCGSTTAVDVLTLEHLNKYWDNNIGSLVACWPMPEGYRGDEMVLKVPLPAAGMKLGLSIKKHSLLGPVAPVWR